MSDVSTLLAADDLTGALAVATAAVKARPDDVPARLVLADLLVLSGDLERADRQLDLAGTFAPDAAAGLGVQRGHLRAMASRADWFERGGSPAFPLGPSEADRAAVTLGLALRDGDADAADAALARLDEVRGERPCTVDGIPVADLRDVDDRTAHALEVATAGGAYLWVDLAHVATLELAPRRRPRDLAWREARLTLRDGSVADVLVALLYHPPAQAEMDDALRLGRRTLWHPMAPAAAVAGLGARCLLAGDDLIVLGEVGRIETADGAEKAADGAKKSADGAEKAGDGVGARDG